MQCDVDGVVGPLVTTVLISVRVKEFFFENRSTFGEDTDNSSGIFRLVTAVWPCLLAPSCCNRIIVVMMAFSDSKTSCYVLLLCRCRCSQFAAMIVTAVLLMKSHLRQ